MLTYVFTQFPKLYFLLDCSELIKPRVRWNNKSPAGIEPGRI